MFDDYTPDPELFAERAEWADVTPIEQYEGVNPLAPILYSNQYKDATDYFRAVVASGEKSTRVLELTEAVIRMNPSHYTAWQYRYETLLSLLPLSASSPALSLLLERENELMDELAIRYLKSYQVWHHRRLLLLLSVKNDDIHNGAGSSQEGATGSEGVKGGLGKEGTDRVKRELEFISRSFDEDSKNYHTWSYRQWVLSHFFGTSPSSKENEEVEKEIDIWTEELDWTESMLNKDIRNNSAWHHRFFVVFQRPGARAAEEEVKREMSYTKESIALAPNNASAWNYLRGVLDHLKLPYKGLEDFVGLYAVSNASKQGDDDVQDLDTPRPAPGADLPCAAAIEFLADAYEQGGETEGVLKAIELWKSLANEHDTMRRRYWEHRIREAIEGRGGMATRSA